MGFITTRNKNGREVYSCEANLEGCLDNPCKAHHCPHKWCQRYYFCDNCWNKLKKEWKSKHKSCQENKEISDRQHEHERLLLAQGKYLRVAALSHTIGDNDKVKVIFREQNGSEFAYFMEHQTYDSIPLLTPATPEDYLKIGNIERCQSQDIYDPI